MPCVDCILFQAVLGADSLNAKCHVLLALAISFDLRLNAVPGCSLGKKKGSTEPLHCFFLYIHLRRLTLKLRSVQGAVKNGNESSPTLKKLTVQKEQSP